MVSSFATTSPESQADALALPGKSGKLQAALSSNSSEGTTSRRAALATVAGATFAFLRPPTAANALDMDAFANAELDKDQKNCNPKLDSKCAPQMSPDEAMCKYGQSGDKRGEACARFKSQGGG
eukprot:scaffold342_cov128-Amphora_coffeaeformis.AAC.6